MGLFLSFLRHTRVQTDKSLCGAVRLDPPVPTHAEPKMAADVCQKVCVEFLQNKNENEVQPGKVNTTQVCDNSAQLFQVFEMRCNL